MAKCGGAEEDVEEPSCMDVWLCGAIPLHQEVLGCSAALMWLLSSGNGVFDHFGHHEEVKSPLTWLYNKRGVSLPCCI